MVRLENLHMNAVTMPTQLGVRHDLHGRDLMEAQERNLAKSSKQMAPKMFWSAADTMKFRRFCAILVDCWNFFVSTQCFESISRRGTRSSTIRARIERTHPKACALKTNARKILKSRS